MELAMPLLTGAILTACLDEVIRLDLASLGVRDSKQPSRVDLILGMLLGLGLVRAN